MSLFGLGTCVSDTDVTDVPGGADVTRTEAARPEATRPEAPRAAPSLTERPPASSQPSHTSAVLPLLVSDGRAPGAALVSRTLSSSRFESAGSGIRRTDRFRAGSTTKTLVATVVLQLAAEGRLRLSDTVEHHLPGLVRGHGNNGRLLTLRMLLSHTSGLYDYTAAVSAPAPTTPRAALRIALTRAPAPLGSYRYSNTDYVLLGLVVKKVTGRSYADEARDRIIVPLGLTGTSFPGDRTTLPSPHGRAYTRDPDSGGARRDVTELDPRPAGAAGELISTLDDLDRFYSALLGGRLLAAPQSRELLDTTAAHGAYGLGIYPQRLSCGLTVWGHNGRISGSYVRTATTADGRRTLTFRVNTDAIPDESLESIEQTLLDAEFCRSGKAPRTRP
ncbi:serine hydrolase domain-containing protein [Streptomyces sp. L-9-10]|uniref:serine hydrolase domain-containing protein n=1 Tax=Streptomyces sp. L-9-10 TaxID=1478131 RepID=UPI00101B6A76|nr:serine hydrolase domain-containing protein [Streptomyces sp. L-9-10]